MKKNIEIVKEGHDLYNEFLYNGLKNYGLLRYRVSLDVEALKEFIKLGKTLSKKKLPKGACLMLGYETGPRRVEDRFIFGGSKDTTKNLNLINDMDRTLDMIINFSTSEEDHDGAFLFSPNGELKHSGSWYNSGWKEVYKSFGYSTYYQFRDIHNITGKTRMVSSLIHSMLFVDALFISISEQDPSRNVFVHNGLLSNMQDYNLKKYRNSPPVQPYLRSPSP